MKRPLPISRRVLVVAGLGLLVCLVTGAAANSGLLNSIELRSYDLLVSSKGPSPPHEALVIVDFDDASVEALNAFPIPRGLLARVIEKASAAGAALIGLDVLLDKRRNPADDQQLANAIASAGNVIIAKNFGTADLPAADPLPEFRHAALDVAFVNLPVDEDGFIRRIFLWIRTPAFAGTSLPVTLASNFIQKPLERGSPGSYRLGVNPVFPSGRGLNTALIGAWSPKPARTVSVQSLLRDDFDTRIFQGKIVLVGQSSAAAKDMYATPVFRFRRPSGARSLLSGAEIHGAAISSLLTGQTIRPLPPAGVWGLNLIVIGLVIAVVVAFRPFFSFLAVAVAVLGVYLLAQTLYSQHQVWLRFASTEAGILLAFPAGLGYRFLEERRLKSQVEAERRQLMGIFERYVSPDVAAEIWERRDEIVLAGQEKTATVLFSDIRNFTALSAGRPSAQVLTWLNDYFTAMSEVIRGNGGFLNKFMGDGMLVVYGVPLSRGVQEDACRAVRTALQMLGRVEELNARQGADRPRIKIGIGIDTGLLTAGNLGARDRLEYSVIGETVNLASRLEALTKEFGCPIIISSSTNDLVHGRFATAPLGAAQIRGFDQNRLVYTVSSEVTSIDRS